MSVVIPTFNRARTLARAVESVLRQTYQDFEIIVVDDGSTDQTASVVAGFRDPRLRYVRHDVNRGANVARNTGVAAARAEFVAFLDSDDEWLPEKLEKQVRLLRQRERLVGAVYTGYVVINGRGEATKWRVPRHRGFLLDELLCGNVIGASPAVIVRRECLREVGGFDPDLASCQDWDMWIRLAKRYSFDFVPEVLVRVHRGEDQRVTGDPRAVAEGHLRIAQKYLEESSPYAPPRRTRHLLALGKLLVSFGSDPGYPEQLRLGRRFLLMGFLAQPWRLHTLVYYAASFNRMAFLAVTGTMPRLRRFLGRVTGRSMDLAGPMSAAQGVGPMSPRRTHQ